MSDIQSIKWSSDGKTPFEECIENIHVYEFHECGNGSLSVENSICKCGKTKWVYEVCPHCNQKRGKAVNV
jgi:hypothetical protein